MQCYESDIFKYIRFLSDSFLKEKILYIWNDACVNRLQERGVFVHGDMALGNIIYENNKLAGIIDFGTMSIGDPSCDLILAWTFFDQESRDIFLKNTMYDRNTIVRSMGWTLWKALLEIDNNNKAITEKYQNAIKTINSIIEYYDMNFRL